MADPHREPSPGSHRAKALPPGAGCLVQRPRLFERLDEAGTGGTTIVVAPGGSGKTSLVASWVEARHVEHVAWYALDEPDRDSRRCLEGICTAIERVHPGTCAAPLAALEAGERDAAVLATLVEALEGCSVTLVLDDFQVLDGAAEHGGPLDRLCRTVPPAMRVIIVSRTVPELGYTWLLATGSLTAITAEDLRFDAGEATALLAAHGGSVEGAEELAQRSDGWAAGLLMLARTAEPALSVAPAGTDPGSHALEALTARRDAAFAVLGDQLLEALPHELRAFALGSAAVCPATSAQVEALLSYDDAPAAFAALRQRGFFVAEDGEGVIRYHGLLAAYLIARQASADPERHRALRRRRATLHVEHGELEQAAALLRADGDWEALREFLYQWFEALCGRGSYRTIAESVEALPAARRTAELMARCGHAWRMLGQFGDAFRWADMALAAGDDALATIHALMVRANALLESGRYVEVPPITQRCAQLAGHLPDANPRTRAVAIAADVEGSALLKLGDRRRGEAQLELAEAYYAGSGAYWHQARVIENRAVGLVRCGWSREALAQADRALALAQEAGDAGQVAFCDYVRALALQLSDGPSAVAIAGLRGAAAALARAGKVCAACMAQGELARAQVEGGSAGPGAELAAQALESALRLDDEEAWRAAQRALIAAAIAQKRTTDARARTAAVRQGSVPPPELAELDYLEGFCDLRGRSYRSAASKLARAAGQLEALDRPHLAARALLLQGEALLARGIAKPAEAAINAAAALAAARQCEGYLLPLARYARAMIAKRRALIRLNAHGRALVQRLATVETSLDSADSEAGCVLDLNPFGAGTVCIDGILVDPAALDAKGRELLFYLGYRGRPVSREEAVEALWPGEVPRRGSKFLSGALYRVRCVCGDQLLATRKRDLTLEAMVHDAGRALLALADEACAAHEAGDLPRAAACLARASAYLGGEPYLPWCASAWATEARSRYAEAAQRLADIDAAMGAARNADATDAPRMPEICPAGRVVQAGTAGGTA